MEHAQSSFKPRRITRPQPMAKSEPNFTPPVTEPVLTMEEAQRSLWSTCLPDHSICVKTALPKTWRLIRGSLERPDPPVWNTAIPNEPDTQERVLAWTLKPIPPPPMPRWIDMNATDGTLIKSLPLTLECFPGSGTTTFNVPNPSTPRSRYPRCWGAIRPGGWLPPGEAKDAAPDCRQWHPPLFR